MTAQPIVVRQPTVSSDIANLDILRAVAVMLVLGNHLTVTLQVRGLGSFGHLGVLLFFVHTALVLMMSMARTGLRDTALYENFLIRRLFRMYPLSVLCVLLVVILRIPITAWAAGYVWQGWGVLVSNLLLTQNLTHSVSVNGVLWSLPYEIQMYALLPIIYLILDKRRRPSTAILLWLLSVGVAFGECVFQPFGSDDRYLLTRYFPCFMSGIIAWSMIGRSNRPKCPSWGWPIALAGLILLSRTLTSWINLHPAVSGNHSWHSYFPDLASDWLCATLTGLLIPHFAQMQSAVVRLIAKTVAKYSYGIYLFHVPVLWLTLVRFRTQWPALNLALALLSLAVVCVAGYHFIEEPFIEWGKRLADRRAKLNPRMATRRIVGSDDPGLLDGTTWPA